MSDPTQRRLFWGNFPLVQEEHFSSLGEVWYFRQGITVSFVMQPFLFEVCEIFLQKLPGLFGDFLQHYIITCLSQPEGDGTALNRSPYVRTTLFSMWHSGTSEKMISDLTATSVLFERIFLQQYGLATLLSTSCFVWLKITWLTHESWFLLTTCSHGGIHRGFHGQAVPHGGLSSKAGFL